MSTLRNMSAMLVLAGLLAGCGKSPTAQEEALPGPQDRILLKFSPEVQAAKAAGTAGQDSQTRNIGPAGGIIKVGSFRDDERALGARFSVPPGALNAYVPITMTLYDQDPAELTIAFAPSGLAFSIPASLNIRIGKSLVDRPIQRLMVLHQHEDGSVERASFEVLEEEESYLIVIVVRGFSLYSLGDGVGYGERY